MKLHLENKYQGDEKKKHTFPSDDLPQKFKEDKSYFRQAAQAIVTRYVNNLCEIPYTAFEGRSSIRTLRDYAAGKQGSDRYKNFLIGAKGEDGCRPKSTINIDWTPLDILPKKIGDVKGYMQKLKYDVITSAIDPMAVFSKEKVKAATKLMTNDLMRNLHEEINNAAGGSAVTPEGQLVGQVANGIPFQNESQVEGFAATGGFQLMQEIAIKILLDKTAYDSGSDVLNDLLIEDLLVLGICGKKHYTDKDSDSVLWDAIDIENAIIPYSRYADFRDATYFGDVKRMSIGELRKTSNLEEKDLIDIAKRYNDATFNKTHMLSNLMQSVHECRESGLGIAVLDSIMVDIADVVWSGSRTIAQTKITREKEGNIALSKVDDDYELNDRSKKKGKELKKYSNQTIYKAKLIVGTDYVFDYGHAQNIPYKKDEKGKMCAVMPFNFYKLTGPSLVERCIGFVNDANMALFKKRLIVKNMPTGPNIRIKKSAFENVKIDGRLQSPADLMALFRDEGFLIEDDQNPWGNHANSGSAIAPIQSDVVQRLTECRNDLQWNIDMIEVITGLNAVFSASTPSSETGLGVSKIAISATENSIYTIVKAFENHYEHGLRICANMWKVIAAYIPDDKRDNFATDRAMNYIRIGKEISLHDYGIMLHAGATDEEKLMLMQKVTQLTDLRRQAGTGGLKPSDELMMFEIIKSGNIKMARMVLAQIEEYRAAEDAKIAEKRYQENSELQKQSNQQASENRQSEIQSEAQAKGNMEMMKIQAQMQLEDKKAENERKLVALQNVYGWSADTYNKTVKHK